jgi:hypothetical protein
VIEVFYSYAHADEDLRDELEMHLAMLKRRGVITGWHDRQIGAGNEWKAEIDAHLSTARVILLLISPAFLASEYCYDIEMARALERHRAGEARVIPIFLRPCDWDGAPFGGLQALPTDTLPVTKWENRDEAFTIVAKGIRHAVEALTGPTAGRPSAPPSAPAPPEVDIVPADIKRKAKAIVQIFERGRPRSYVAIDRFGGDMIVGYALSSLKDGRLAELLTAYCGEPDARFVDALRPYLDRAAAADPALIDDAEFASRFKLAAGEDPAMIRVQDRAFDELYWRPTAQKAAAIGVKTPLGIAAIFDTVFHVGPGAHNRLKAQVVEALDGTPITGVDEKVWIVRYLEQRRARLAKVFPMAVDRPSELLRLAQEGNWALDTPLTIQGQSIS